MGSLRHFNFASCGSPEMAKELLRQYPMDCRNSDVYRSQIAATDAIFSNAVRGKKLIIPNFQTLRRNECGYSRQTFIKVLRHWEDIRKIIWPGNGSNRSVILYTDKTTEHIPTITTHYPRGTIMVRNKNKDEREAKIVKLINEERRTIDKRLRGYWEFINKHKICTGISDNDFEVINNFQVNVLGKSPLVKPDPHQTMPYMMFNDDELRTGGRMYGCFWINMPKILRRSITIDGEKTCDLDGKGMHVQLLYKRAGLNLPVGDIYIYLDERRIITKRLMLYMMNTYNDYDIKEGRKRVKNTYIKKHGKKDDRIAISYDKVFEEYKYGEGALDKYILELENHHHGILSFLYKSNWGSLQKTEAMIMLNIMEAGMKDDIVILPVHDGCLCPKKHKDRVLQFFADQGIDACENTKHLVPVSIDVRKSLLTEKAGLKQGSLYT